MGKLKALLALLVLGSAIYVGWNLIPPYFSNQQFQDDLYYISRRNSYSNATEEDISKMVVEKADRSYGIPLKPKQITVTKTRDGINISVQYRVHVDLILHPMDIDFTANSINKRI